MAHNIEKAELTNMCMIYDNEKVLVQNRVKSWCGIAFPGGHLEECESIVDSTIREVKEETGLDICSLELCGIKQWFCDGVRNICFLYKTNKYSGNLISSNEGENFWVSLDEIDKYKLAPGFSKMLDIFLDKDLSEYYHLKKKDEIIDTLK